MISPEVFSRNGSRPHFPLNRTAEIGHSGESVDEAVRRNIIWGLSKQAQKYLGLRPLEERYKEQGREYPKEESEERKALERYYLSKHLDDNYAARNRVQERFGRDVVDTLGLIRFYEDYKKGPVPDLFGRFHEEFYFISQSLPRTSVDLFAEKLDTPIGEMIEKRVPPQVKKFAIAAFAAGVIYSARTPGRFS